MKNTFKLLMAAASAAAIFASCSKNGQDVLVSNTSDLARVKETVEIPFADLKISDDALTPDNVVVLDFSGKQVPSQVYTERMESRFWYFRLMYQSIRV